MYIRGIQQLGVGMKYECQHVPNLQNVVVCCSASFHIGIHISCCVMQARCGLLGTISGIGDCSYVNVCRYRRLSSGVRRRFALLLVPGPGTQECLKFRQLLFKFDVAFSVLWQGFLVRFCDCNPLGLQLGDELGFFARELNFGHSGYVYIYRVIDRCENRSKKLFS